MDSPPVRRLLSSGSIPVGGFTPGLVIAGRYRIIGLLGRGGMGEVYRADDMTLGQPVALKFLPASLADDPVRRERLLAEVRIARQVSHPNLCRVYDVAELGGRHFLTMEYIDGEDLASLLERIGSLHGAKALDIARQLCAGLAAAHDRGVLHRDLKPANVMIDGRGRVRITDFGIAVAAADDTAADATGTPAYMAPEQFAGQRATVRTDIYALGLVLYELYTGACVYTASTLAELRAQKHGLTPTAPSEITRDIDPVVERVILRCLEKDPQQRPASAAQVAAALPGGDPLALAIAAGETPSPEMVAAAGPTVGLRPLAAWGWLALLAVATAAMVWLTPKTHLIGRVPLDKPPDVLAERARNILARAGYNGEPAYSAFGLDVDSGYFRHVMGRDQSPSRFDVLPDGAVVFWYRRSPSPIDADAVFGTFRATAANPPLKRSGDALVFLNGRGQLIYLKGMPERRADSADLAPAKDWTWFFTEAGLDIRDWAPAAPIWAPPYFAESRAAWSPVDPGRPGVPLRIEAAAHRGRVVEWWRVDPWDDPAGTQGMAVVPGQNAAAASFVGIVATLLIGAGWLGRRNVRLGRGDRRGATRLAVATFGLVLLMWILGNSHAATWYEFWRFLAALASACFMAAAIWILYIAIEPFARRRWPGVLVSWNRLLGGQWRDPVLGRDVLVGWTLGVAVGTMAMAATLAAKWSTTPGVQPLYGDLSILLGGRFVAAWLAEILLNAFAAAFGLFLLFLLARLALRRDWIACAVLTLLTVLMNLAQGLPISLVAGLQTAVFLVLLLRLGFVGSLTSVVASVSLPWPVPASLSAWYAGIGIAGVIFALAVPAIAFYVSLGGRPVFGRALIDE